MPRLSSPTGSAPPRRWWWTTSTRHSLPRKTASQPRRRAGSPPLEWEEGRGLFAGVDWTDKARAHIRAGEYRYISPVFAFDRQSGAVLRLICAALTNHPALDGMDAASATFTPTRNRP